MSKTQPARGTRDFLPSDVKKRNYVINIIREVYESYGFEPLETPSIENLETLTGKYGEEGNQLMFKILKRGEKLQEELAEGKIKRENELSDLALRYDLTVPLARVVANNKNELPKFFKRYQIQPVWRADRPARGRYREFYQCDVDAIGSNSMMVEAELCAAVSEILQKLKFNDFEIRLNHRNILTGLLETVEIPLDKHTDALVAIDKLDKIGESGVLHEFKQRGISETAGTELLKFIKDTAETIKVYEKEASDLYGEENIEKFGIEEFEAKKFMAFNEGTLDVLREFFVNSKSGIEGTDNLGDITKLTETVKAKGVRIDLGLARGLSYYTGTIFEIVLTNGDFTGSIGGGGRYDGLIGMFGKEQIPACGFSLGLERILVVMEERGMFQKLIDEGKLNLGSADVLVTLMEETAGESLKLANELRKENLRVLVYPENDKLGKQFKYADSIGVDYVCVLGDAELAENKVTLKNMRTGEQETYPREEIGEKIRKSSSEKAVE